MTGTAWIGPRRRLNALLRTADYDAAMAEGQESNSLLSNLIAVPALFVIMFVAPDYIGDVSLEGLDAYVQSAPIGSTLEQVDAGVRHFAHCYYRKPRRIETGDAVDYIFRGTTSDAGFFVSVTVHCPLASDRRLSHACTRKLWALIPADVEGYERRTNTLVTQADEWSNAGQPDCPVRD
jgi:hypothetical protein